MKAAQSVLKIAAVVLAAAAAVCAVVVFWDKITAGVGSAADKLRCRRQYAEGCCVDGDDEDYTDWDE